MALVLSIVIIGASGLSVLGALAIVIMFLRVSEHSFAERLVFYISLTDIQMSLAIMYSQVPLLWSDVQPDWWCKSAAWAVLFGQQSELCWTFMFSVNVYMMICHGLTTKKASRYLPLYIATGWGVPALITSILLGTEYLGAVHVGCWVKSKHNMHLWAFYLPLIVILSATVLVYARVVLAVYAQQRRIAQRARELALERERQLWMQNALYGKQSAEANATADEGASVNVTELQTTATARQSAQSMYDPDRRPSVISTRRMSTASTATEGGGTMPGAAGRTRSGASAGTAPAAPAARVSYRATLYILVFIAAWAPTTALSIYTNTFGGSIPLWLLCIQFFMFSMQGFFNSIVYGANALRRNPQFRALLRLRLSRLRTMLPCLPRPAPADDLLYDPNYAYLDPRLASTQSWEWGRCFGCCLPSRGGGTQRSAAPAAASRAGRSPAARRQNAEV